MFLPVRMAMAEAIQFDGEARFFAIKIKAVNAFWMLSPKLITRETPVTQPAPHEFFRPSFLFAECAGTFGIGHDENVRVLMKK